MDEETFEKIKSLAEDLLETLLPNVDPKEADKIVKDVALSLYKDILKLNGKIEIKYTGHICERNYIESYGLKCSDCYEANFLKQD